MRVLLLTLCGLALFAPIATAQDDDIHVDPGSPSGKEYALPVDSARSQAASPDGGSALVIILGAGVGVLLAGGLIGLALRRRAAR